MSSTFSSPCGVSIMASTTVASLESAGLGPIRSCERMGPYERMPWGGYFANDTARAASSAVLTSGTMTPAAPAVEGLADEEGVVGTDPDHADRLTAGVDGHHAGEDALVVEQSVLGVEADVVVAERASRSVETGESMMTQ